MKNITSYRIIYRDRFGVYKTDISEWFKLEYAKKENDFGSLYIDVPDVYPANFFEIDGRFEVWRKVGAYEPYLDMETYWLIRLIRNKFSKGDKFIHILCHDATNIIDRRIVAYACDTSYTHKNTYADNMIRAIVRENFGTLCTDTNRDISPYMTIQDDPATSTAPILEKSFCRQKVLPLLQDICNEAFENNETHLTFDVVYNGNGIPQFKVFTGQRGTDRTGLVASVNQFIFSVDAGNLEYATLAYDHSEEFNYIYAGGSGSGDSRIIATAYNNTWINKSPINRREDFISASDDTKIETVQADANARLKEAGPQQKLNGHIVENINSLYGLHFFFGDKVLAMHNGVTIPIHLDNVKVTVSGDGDQNVQIFTRNLDDTEY